MTPFLITGNAHSGTGWASKLFTRLGFPCGHEYHFNTDRHELKGSDSSWLAVPYLSQLPPGARIIHLVRDPLDVVRSYLRTDLEDDPYRTSSHYRFMCHHRPDICAPEDRLARVIRRVCTWDAPLFRMRVMRVRVEDCTTENVDLVQDMIFWATRTRVNRDVLREVLRELGQDVNPHARQFEVSFTADDARGTAIQDRATLLGYAEGYG